MRVLILAAGLGTRLRPLTNTTPKALVPVNGMPMLHYSLLLLRKHGITEARINVHHLGDQIIEFVKDSKEKYGIEVHVQDERDALLGSGGGIALAKDWLFEANDSALIWNPDGLLFPDLTNFIQQYESIAVDKPHGSIIVFPHPDVGTRYNPVCTDKGKVIAFGDTEADHQKKHFAGGYILSKSAVDLLPEAGQESCVVKKVWFPLVQSREFYTFDYSGPYQDLGCPDDIQDANSRFQAGEFATFL